MTRAACVAFGMMFVAASGSAQPPPSMGLADGLKFGYTALKQNLTQSAEKMPEADYASKPSTMPEVRTFGQVIGHIANAQFFQCATARGAANPNQVNFEQKTAKAELVKALADSFAFCDDAFASVTDQTAMEMVSNGRGGQLARGAMLTQVISHGSEMYGIATVYLRAKNIVPPSTENQGRGRGGRGRQ